MLPYRRLFKYRMGRYRGSYEILSKYRLIIRYSIYRSIAIPSSIDIERSQVSRYFDISSIEPALLVKMVVFSDGCAAQYKSKLVKMVVFSDGCAAQYKSKLVKMVVFSHGCALCCAVQV